MMRNTASTCRLDCRAGTLFVGTRWSDVYLEHAAVTWQASNDKEGKTHTTPLTLAAVATLKHLRRSADSPFDGWVFASPSASEEPCSRDWWERIAKLAKPPRGERMGWHSLRRGFATSMRDAQGTSPAIGGWASYNTSLSIYIRPDLDAQRGAFAMRRALSATSQQAAEAGVA